MDKERQLFHRVYGHVSGIPDCCVEFWLSWYIAREFDELNLSYYFACCEWGYIPCPDCLWYKDGQKTIKCGFPYPPPWEESVYTRGGCDAIGH